MIDKENYHLEYKTAKKSVPKDFWETYSAFANTDGGKVIFGISEENKFQYKLVGVTDPDKIKTDLLNQLGDSAKVSTNLVDEKDVKIITKANKKLVEITIKPANYEKKPVYLNNQLGNAYVRVGDGDRKIKPEQLKYLIANSSEHIDNELLDNYTIADLNTADIDNYRNILIKNTGNDKLKNLSYEQFLFEIGAIKIDRNNNNRDKKLTVGALLFFGKYNAILDKFKGFQLDYFKKNSSIESSWMDRISSGDMNFPEMNIFSFYQQTLVKLTQSISDKFTQDADLTRGSYRSDLVIAVKEALVNSLMHAYYDSDKPISIYDYHDYYEFNNPGDMRVSKEEFIHGNNPVTRNSIISVLFRKVGIAERAGSGGPRIFESAEKNHLRIPDIVKKEEFTTIRIWKVDLLASLHDLSDNEKRIVEYAMDHPLFSIKELVENTKLTDFKVRKLIKKLFELGTVDRVGNGKSTRYTLNSNEETSILGFKLLVKKFEDGWNK
ncbi:putative DNA binding domain-containing protein [Pediococcus pentosaceus]|uniref:RNA-binding domain-containing protein n=1 Tax=Pediococcus pentosaceus TaxID=1255 RepID=UPI0018E16A8C|nr:RNA-binding domain-containing protein [Pediococcus pentosaceus]MBF7105074.1 putative DNA binding domain-containing protein [Pediococcus pentosaceus]QQC61217.1 putative DNA binding domain-containing protein [Pediococcus pentosaceus]